MCKLYYMYEICALHLPSQCRYMNYMCNTPTTHMYYTCIKHAMLYEHLQLTAIGGQ